MSRQAVVDAAAPHPTAVVLPRAFFPPREMSDAEPPTLAPRVPAKGGTMSASSGHQHPSEGRAVTQQSLFVAEADGLEPTEWAVGPWSPDTLQASAYGALLVRALERSEQVPGMMLARLSFDLWRPVTRQHLTAGTSILRDGRKRSE